MINDKELIFVVDEENNPLEPMPRDEVHKNGIWHRTTDIWVLNSKGELLCEKRSMAKDVSPGEWESIFGGHTLAGEDDLESAIKEIEEELGLKVKGEELKFFKTVKASDREKNFQHNRFKSVYLLNFDGNSSEIDFEEEEIDEVKWVGKKEVRRILEHLEKNWVIPAYGLEFLDWMENQV